MRNGFKKGLAIGAGLGLLAFAAACSQPPRTVPSLPPTAAHSDTFRSLDDIRIGFSSVDVESALQLEMKDRLPNEVVAGLSSYFKTLHQQGYPEMPDAITTVTIDSIDQQYILAQGTATESLEAAAQGIQELKRYLSGTQLQWPAATFVVPSTPEQAKKGIEPSKTLESLLKGVDVYFVNYGYTKIGISGKVLYGSSIIPFGLQGKVKGDARGEITVRENPNQRATETKYGNIVINLSNAQGAVEEVTASEYLHVILMPGRQSHLTQQLTSSRTEEQAVLRTRNLNEYVVHGITGELFSAHGQKDNQSGWNNDPNVVLMRKLIQQEGPVKVIELYQRSPEQLITAAGIDMTRNQ